MVNRLENPLLNPPTFYRSIFCYFKASQGLKILLSLDSSSSLSEAGALTKLDPPKTSCFSGAIQTRERSFCSFHWA